MGLFSRMKRIVKSNVNAVLDKMENPEASVDAAIEGMASELEKAKDAVTQAMVDVKKLERAVDAGRKEAADFKERATRLVQKGDDESARKALSLHKSTLEQVTLNEKRLDSQRDHARKLKIQVDEMGKRVLEAKAKRGEMISRMRTAQAAKMGSVEPNATPDASDPFSQFKAFEDGIEEQETRQQVMSELSGDGEAQAALDALDVKARDDDVDDELAKLKAELDGQ